MILDHSQAVAPKTVHEINSKHISILLASLVILHVDGSLTAELLEMPDLVCKNMGEFLFPVLPYSLSPMFHAMMRVLTRGMGEDPDVAVIPALGAEAALISVSGDDDDADAVQGGTEPAAVDDRVDHLGCLERRDVLDAGHVDGEHAPLLTM